MRNNQKVIEYLRALRDGSIEDWGESNPIPESEQALTLLVTLMPSNVFDIFLLLANRHADFAA